MQHSENLLAFPPIQRQVLLFPLTKRVGKIRHTAQKLVGKNGDDANLYWRQIIATNRKHLERVGLPNREIDRELRAFFGAVQHELVRLSACEKSSGGAA